MATHTTSLFTCLASYILYDDGKPTYAAPSKYEGQARDCWRWKKGCHMVFSNVY